jgi:type I restriction enzyme R subunit
MLGRATRRCDAINKTSFKIFDAVRVYETLEDYTTMKPVAPNPSTTFVQLIEELDLIESEARVQRQIEQIIAKFQRKRKYISNNEEDKFNYISKGISSDDFVQHLKGISPINFKLEIEEMNGVWKYLDELKPDPTTQLFSEHEDEYITTERGYGKGQKPEDYLESLKSFIEQNRNKILALQIICTRPKELDRKSLKELKLILDQEGFNTRSLNAAWKATKNEDVAADIISYIRTLAVGTSLISHEQRIKNAIDKIRSMKSWNKVQEKWIERFEKQLLQEEVIQAEDLNLDPFDEVGGFDKLDKVFEFELKNLLEQLNENLYTEIA